MPPIMLAPAIVASPVQNGAPAPTAAAATAMANAVMQQLESITTNVNNTSNGDPGASERAPEQVRPPAPHHPFGRLEDLPVYCFMAYYGGRFFSEL